MMKLANTSEGLCHVGLWANPRETRLKAVGWLKLLRQETVELLACILQETQQVFLSFLTVAFLTFDLSFDLLHDISEHVEDGLFVLLSSSLLHRYLRRDVTDLVIQFLDNRVVVCLSVSAFRDEGILDSWYFLFQDR